MAIISRIVSNKGELKIIFSPNEKKNIFLMNNKNIDRANNNLYLI
jgi:hypothetical protein